VQKNQNSLIKLTKRRHVTLSQTISHILFIKTARSMSAGLSVVPLSFLSFFFSH